ncbi:MAG: hypothetical protein LBR50_05600 [Tannerella sp.]|jgi:hypothetical protein|nr:hypothetical protein [Tannerella sp.]
MSKKAQNKQLQIRNSTAENEFEKYRPIQDRLFESDFDRAMKILENKDDEN